MLLLPARGPHSQRPIALTSEDFQALSRKPNVSPSTSVGSLGERPLSQDQAGNGFRAKADPAPGLSQIPTQGQPLAPFV